MNKSQSLLERFFDASLIPSDTTDDRLGHYQAAAAALTKRFKETPKDLVSASRVAIDSSCPATEPWFEIVQDAVKAHWKTFLVKHHDAPRQICRAILLEALSKSADEDWTSTLAIWNAASSLLPHFGEGPEQLLTREFIEGLAIECEAHSSSEWRIGANADGDLPEVEIKLPAMKASQVEEAELTKGMSDAVGPSDQQGIAHGNPNPYWPGNAQNWAYQFAPRAAKAVATAVNKALATTFPPLKGLSEQLVPALKKHGSALKTWVAESAQRNERFTALLWWKQALYSPQLECSYRDLSPSDSAIALSFDLSVVSGAPVPLSVEFFLRETLRDLVPDNRQWTFAEFIAATKSSKAIASCLPTAPSGPVRRISLREFLSLTRQAPPPEEMVHAYVGILPTTSLALSEWAVWLLRERLAEMLTAPKT